MAIPLQQKIDSKHSDRGGYKILAQIFRANLPYEAKIKNTQDQFLVSRGTAVGWYTQHRAEQGLR